MSKELSIALVGAGAVGSYYGGRLAAAGEDVRFLLRSDFEAVRERGLTVESVHGDFRLDSPAVFRTPEEIGPVDLVVIAWKSTANRHYETVVAPLLGSGTAILTLQNGLGNTEELARLFGPERVMGGLCFVCINRIEPGLVRHTGGGAMTVGEFGRPAGERVNDVVRRFCEAGIKCEAVDDLALAQWKKLVWNVPFNGLCITEGGIDTEVLLGRPGGEERVRTIMAEVVAGAAALGHEIDAAFVEKMVEVTRPMGAYRPSSMIDFVEGRSVEVAEIWREPLRRATAAGADLPEWQRLLGEIEAACDNP